MPSRTIPRNGRQLCAWSRALSTTSHNILWDVFRSVARCGENWRKSRRAAGAAPLHRPRSLCVCSQGEIQQRQTANPRAASPTDANTICPQLAGLRVMWRQTGQAGEGSEDRLPVLQAGCWKDVLPSRECGGRRKIRRCPSIQQGECHDCARKHRRFRPEVCRRLPSDRADAPSRWLRWVPRYRLRTSAIAWALSASVCAKTRLRSRMDCSASSMKRLAVSYCALASSFSAR